MKKLYDLVNLSSIFTKQSSSFFQNMKMVRIVEYFTDLSIVYKQRGKRTMINRLIDSITINTKTLPYAGVCMYTVFVLIALFVMTLIHKNKNKKWTIIPSILSLIISELLFVLKYLMNVPKAIDDIIDMAICMSFAFVFGLYYIFTNRPGLFKFFGYLLILNVYQIVYSIIDSPFVLYAPFFLSSMYAVIVSEDITDKLLVIVVILNNLMMVINQFIPLDTTILYHVLNIPCFYLVWYALLSQDSEEKFEARKIIKIE